MKLNKPDTSGKTSFHNKNNQLHFPLCHMARHAEHSFPPGFVISFEKRIKRDRTGIAVLSISSHKLSLCAAGALKA